MKKIFILSFIFSTFLGRSATCTWIGGSGTSFTTTANWLLGIAPIPGNNDDIVFGPLGGANNCVVPTTGTGIDVNSISLVAGYTGIVDLGADDHNLGGSLTINAGTLIFTSGIIYFNNGNAVFTLGGSGVLNHNNGTVEVSSSAGNSFSFSGSIILNNLNLTSSGGSSAITVDFGSNLQAQNIALITPGSRQYVFQGTIHVKSSLSLANSSHVINNSANNGTFIFDGSSATIIGTTAGAGRAYLANIVINTAGACTMSNDINVRGNWTGTMGNLNAGSSTVNMYGSSTNINGTAAAFHNLVIQSGASVTLPAAEVKIGGNLSRTGTLNFQTTGAIGLNGTSNQSADLNSAVLNAVTCYSSAAGRNVTLSGTIQILDSLGVHANVALATGGALTLKASSSLKARVGQLAPSASISGNVTVETFIPGGATGWANMGVSGITGQLVSSWDTYVSSSKANGIPMTCDGCFYDPSTLGNWFESIAGWDETLDNYDTNIVASTPLAPGRGFWVYVGDGVMTSNNLKLINNGSLVTGLVIAPLTGMTSGYNLVANPYACPIDWLKVYNFGANSINVNATIYAFNADLSNHGSYNASNAQGINGLTNILPAGQGFYVVRDPSAFSDLEFDEPVKVESNTGGILKPGTATSSRFRLKLYGASDKDEMLFCFNSDATDFFDTKYDGYKIFQSPGYVGYPGSYDKYTTISSKDAFDVNYSIHTMPLLTGSVSIPVLVRVSGTGSYTISATDFNNFNSCLTLIDKLTGAYHDLKQGDYVFSINDTTSAPRFDLILCRDESVNPTGIAEQTGSNPILINQDEQGAFVKTAFRQKTKATISVYNIVGQKLTDDIQVEGTATNTRLNLNLHNQVVLIRVVTDQESSTRKMVLH